ncbi:unnamed protein product [Adineta steineri]|uniref:Uncharacterized protein n=1 Tax=Adineta steineri TaxID=433720 RepID=A0A814E2V3_9BILA|nr:unnamed protein product [Adineta steineri]CAF0961736.1 unnamed protein product [Adineta steineri]
MFDRLDFLIINSYLIIQCNENEIQSIGSVTSFEELEANLKCSNKNKLLQHTIDNVQVINFSKVIFKCIGDKKIRITGHFVRSKSSLDKSKNGVEWPFIHTEIKTTSPIKMKFLDKKEIDIILDEISLSELAKENDIYIYMDFVNRPMVCSFFWQGIDKNTHGKSCDNIPVKDFQSPTCYYKVNNTVAPSRKELEDIINEVSPYYYDKDPSINYIYIGPNSGSSNNGVLNNATIGANSITIQNNKNPTGSKKKSNKNPVVIAISDKSNNKTQSNNEKKNSKTILILLIIFICLILIVISIIFYYKEFLKNNNELTKNDSNTSNESQISVLSNPTELNNDDLIIPSLEQIKNDKQQTMQRTATNWFELEEEI